MASTIDYGLVRTVTRREAGLALRSVSVWVVWFLLALSMIGLVLWAKHKGGPVDNADDANLYVLNFLSIWLPMSFMLNSIQVGASISEEKAKKVVEILLSAVRAEELYLGKVLGTSFVSVLQIIGIWIVVVASMLGSGAVEMEYFPWVAALCMLLFGIIGYFIFTALYSTMAALVTKFEDFTIMQLPVMLLFFVTVAVPATHMVGWGTFGEGWLATVGMIPPISMGAAPMNYFIGDGQLWALLVSGVFLLLLAVVTLQLGSKVFRSRVIK